MSFDDLYANHNPWLVRAIIMNLVCFCFALYRNETIKELVFRIIFTNIVGGLMMFGVDLLIYKLNRK